MNHSLLSFGFSILYLLLLLICFSCIVDSQHGSSLLTYNEVYAIRERILRFFNVDSRLYSVVFTAGKMNCVKLDIPALSCLHLTSFRILLSIYLSMDRIGCTAALKLVGECFPWSESSQFHYLQENHNSVLGIRELASQKGAQFQVSFCLRD